MKNVLCNTLLLLAIAVFDTQAQTNHGANVISNKQKVVDLLKSIETGDQAPAAYINPEKYIQHNLAVADGLAGFGALLQQLPPHSAKVNTVRVFQDGDYVFAHTAYDFFGPKIGFDIFRFEHGLIVEHWDNLQQTPEIPNPSGHSMIDGATDLTDTEKTQANKELVKNFVTTVLLHGDTDKFASYFDGDHYIQHNPGIPDQVSGVVNAFKERAKNGEKIAYKKIHQLLGEGNFVLVVSEANQKDKTYAMYDLFRVANGKIAEHWDTKEEIPPRSQWKNNNGKF